jgi:hypothetical protein
MKVIIYSAQDMANFVDILVRNGYVCKIRSEIQAENNLVYVIEVSEVNKSHQLLTEKYE